MLISNVAEAAATLSKTWPDRTNAAYVNAASLLSKTIAGTCRPKVAFEAYRIAAGRQGLLLDGRFACASTHFVENW
ncbi:MAG: DUF982 domain-containing protein [Mesorhizobium sp.]|nr:DUF982 domain-containing protein [Mesorhizobium sp. M8A.F.Ca.ET.023.01.1.1]RWC69609.1 MAG: DUF982 domain-containing protein [Mesorhizobium sp.]